MDRFKFKKQVIAFILVIMQVCTPIMAIADSLIPENPVFDLKDITPDRPNVTPDRHNVTPDRPNNDLPWNDIIPIIPNPDDKQAPIDNDIPRDKGEETPEGLPVDQEQTNDTVIPTDNITTTPGNNTELDQGALEIKNKNYQRLEWLIKKPYSIC